MGECRDVRVKNKHLVLDPRLEVYFLGPDSVFEDSRIDINVSARGVGIIDSRFINCTIRVKRQLNNFGFQGAYFENCQFKGRGVAHSTFTDGGDHL